MIAKLLQNITKSECFCFASLFSILREEQATHVFFLLLCMSIMLSLMYENSMRMIFKE